MSLQELYENRFPYDSTSERSVLPGGPLLSSPLARRTVVFPVSGGSPSSPHVPTHTSPVPSSLTSLLPPQTGEGFVRRTGKGEGGFRRGSLCVRFIFVIDDVPVGVLSGKG